MNRANETASNYRALEKFHLNLMQVFRALSVFVPAFSREPEV